MTTGGQPDETEAGGAGRAVPDAENYLDLSGVEDDDHGPHFDVVLRGYDRRQVDDHVAGLRRMVAQLRAQLAVRERRRGSSGDTGPAEVPVPAVEAIPAARTPPGDEADDGDELGAFNDRLRGILQAAEQEAQAVRSRAAETLLAEHAESRAALADLRSQRDAVVDELVRLRGWLDEIVSHPGRAPAAPPPVMHPGPPRGVPWSPPGPPPGRPPLGPPAGRYAPLRPAQGPGPVTGPGSGGFAAPVQAEPPRLEDEPDTVDGGEHDVRDASESGSGTPGR